MTSPPPGEAEISLQTHDDSFGQASDSAAVGTATEPSTSTDPLSSFRSLSVGPHFHSASRASNRRFHPYSRAVSRSAAYSGYGGEAQGYYHPRSISQEYWQTIVVPPSAVVDSSVSFRAFFAPDQGYATISEQHLSLPYGPPVTFPVTPNLYSSHLGSIQVDCETVCTISALSQKWHNNLCELYTVAGRGMAASQSPNHGSWTEDGATQLIRNFISTFQHLVPPCYHGEPLTFDDFRTFNYEDGAGFSLNISRDMQRSSVWT
ncbi:hypothetical protein M231_03513 [Tremella mesenterica]|uniref:Uncharacterized protein n=1 Tax=Tremella mesenterica TaxID=5217 RepID=A0A4Q1BMV8_TREME|nr:hypothetical protein M231_03513 [Tremella mesenterica]